MAVVDRAKATALRSVTSCPSNPATPWRDLCQPYSSAWADLPASRSFASNVGSTSDTSMQPKPIKKGLSAGTVPPAAEQVPHEPAQRPSSSAHGTDTSASTASQAGSTSSTPKSSATVGIDRPSASAIPAGVDQVPPSSDTHTASAKSSDDAFQNRATSPSASFSQQSGTSNAKDAPNLSQGESQSSAAAVGRWQRFKWWIWGTPQKFWTYQDATPAIDSTKSESTDAASSSTDIAGGAGKWRRSKWSIADIIASAILRSGITKDEDVARSSSCFFRLS